jgi:ketosteroid isomerase-like protein
LEEALHRGDQKEYLAHVAEDIEFRYVADRELVRGKSALRKELTKWSQMADYESQIQSRWAAGDWVVSASQNVTTMKAGTKQGKSKKVGTEQLCFARIANNEVKALWIFENTAAYAAQEGNMTSAEHKDEMSTKPARLKAGSLSLQ